MKKQTIALVALLAVLAVAAVVFTVSLTRTAQPFGLDYLKDTKQRGTATEVVWDAGGVDAERMLFVYPIAGEMGREFWVQLPKDGPTAADYQGKALEVRVKSARMRSGIEVITPSEITELGAVVHGTVDTVDEKTLVISDLSSGGEKLAQKTLTVTFTPDTVMPIPLEEGDSVEVIRDEDNNALWVTRSNG